MSVSPTSSFVDPFNHYNTEFVKLDANNWQESPLASSNSSNRDGLQQFVMVNANDDPLEYESRVLVDSINNKSFTDVTFIVGPPQHSKKYVGHRVLLAMTSPVFETMFYGDMADKNKYIRIADVAPIGFENLLRYAYTDSLNLGSVEDAMLTAYAAKKYLLPQLLRECLTYIELNISPSTACVVFEFAHVLNSQQLVLQAMNLIDRQTSSVIASKSFNHVQASTVEFVANRKYLNPGSEFALFCAVLSWAQAEVKRRQLSHSNGGLIPDWVAVRSILREHSVLSAIRFLAMSPEEFARAVARSSAEGVDPMRQLRTPGAECSSQTKADTAQDDIGASNAVASGEPVINCAIDFDETNCLLNDREQRAVLFNLAMANVARVPHTISAATSARRPPPEHFTLRRFRSASSGVITTTTTTRSIKSITSKFQCPSENVFIVALTIPIRLDAGSYANRTPKFDCHLKFTTKTTPNSQAGGAGSPMPPTSLATSANAANSTNAQSPLAGNGAGGGIDQHASEATAAAVVGLLDGSGALLMDTIDESLQISIARDKDCLVRLKRPILIRMGNLNELTLTFQTYALDEDIVALQTPKSRSANFSELTDGENISWRFFKTSNIEFSEIHYYY